MFEFKSRVYFGDTDAAQVVYHGRYIYWMEAARIDMLIQLGMPYSEFQKKKIGFIPVDIRMRYMKPLRFEENFTIITTVQAITPASFTLESQFVNEANETVCTGTVKLACVNESTWKPSRLPNRLLNVLKESTIGKASNG